MLATWTGQGKCVCPTAGVCLAQAAAGEPRRGALMVTAQFSKAAWRGLDDLFDALVEDVASGTFSSHVPDICACLLELSGSERSAWHQMEFSQFRARVEMCPDADAADALAQSSEEFVRSSPWLLRYVRNSGLRVFAPADTGASWRSSRMYDFLSSRLSTAETLVIPISLREGVFVSCLVGRGACRYDETERRAIRRAQRMLVSVDRAAYRLDRLRRQVEMLTDPTQAGELGRPRLATREIEVLHTMATGRSRRQAALVLGISERTVDKHLENINAKLGTTSLLEALNAALIVRRAPWEAVLRGSAG